MLIPINGTDPAQNTARAQLSRILTSSCILISQGGICPPLSSGGTPVPCTPAPASGWINASSRIRCGHKPVLTAQTFCNCALNPAAVIRPQLGSMRGKVFQCTGGAPGSQNSTRQRRPMRGDEESRNDAVAVRSHGSADEAIKTRVLAAALPIRTEVTSSDVSMDKDTDEVRGSCYGCDPHKRAACEYQRIKAEAADVDNDSKQLRRNYMAERSPEWKTYADDDKKARKAMDAALSGPELLTWSTAMHHIVPGNEVLLTNRGNPSPTENLTRLLCYYGYDVNVACNGIPLPTFAQQSGSDSVTNDADREDKPTTGGRGFDIMRATHRQLHAGRHRFKLASDDPLASNLTEYYEAHKNRFSEDFQYPSEGYDYASCVLAELKRVVPDEYWRSDASVCWEESYDNRKHELITHMNKVSQTIGDHLNSFSKDPRSSFPFFVSKAAAEYAFDCKTEKVVVIYRKSGELRAALTHVVCHGVRKSNPPAMEVIVKNELVLNDSVDGQREFIRFCKNAMYFIIDSRERYTLPFTKGLAPRPAVEKLAITEENVESFLSAPRQAAVLWNMFESYAFGWQPVKGTIIKRGG